MKNELLKAIALLDLGHIGKTEALSVLKELIWKEYKGKTLELFLEIQERERLATKKREHELSSALEFSMQYNSTFLSYLSGEKTSVKKAKQFASEVILGDNIAYIIPIIKAYFQSGHCRGASGSGQWLFKEFVKQLLLHKEKYAEGGDSREWAINYGYAEYIDDIIIKYSNNEGK